MKYMMDTLFENLTRFLALLVLVVLVAVFVVLYNNAEPAIEKYGLSFVTNEKWAPNMNIFGGFPAILGSVLSTLIAMLLATPIAIGIAIFLSEIAPAKLKTSFGVSIELLAAIPSVIYGMWGLFYFAPVVREIFGGNGIGLLTGGFILAVMIFPFIAAITRDSMNTTPDILKESAYALGATKWDVIKDVVIPYAKAGVIGSVILALGRAIGETMAVTFVIGNVHQIPSLITDATTSIPVTLANEFNEAESKLHYASLFYLALLLFAISFIVIAFAKFYFLRKVRKAK
ncbi:MAG: phosphate ABC transporter permease subunit PstC [Campylobacterales bacterium]|nr:phosphate ABC transporter permease subunit PstC [Campylobacterales bacterium]